MAKETDKDSEKGKEKHKEAEHAAPEAKKASEAKKPAKKEAKADKPATAKAKPEGSSADKKKAPATQRVKLSPRTYFAKDGEIPAAWRLVDATDQPLGRLSTLIATMLMGKDKPTYTRSSDTGDHVIVVNAEKVRLTGNKLQDKEYNYHTNFPGGIKTFTAKEIMEKHPDRLILWSVYGMLPKGHMGRTWYKKLRVYKGTEHPHIAQQPKPVTLPNIRRSERA